MVHRTAAGKTSPLYYTHGYVMLRKTKRNYIVICRVGSHYPKHLHSRDASYPEFRTEEPDPSLLCGALVSGPYAPGKFGDDGPVTKGT